MKRLLGILVIITWAGCSKDDPTELGLQIISLLDPNQYSTKITGVVGDEGAWGVREVATGDVNGDFIPDLIMGAPGADLNNKTNNGAVYVKFGATAATFPTGVVDTATVANTDIQYHGATASAAGAPLGASIAVGDLNGDGLADIVMGDPDADFNGRTDSGSVYVVFGGTGISTGVHDLALEQLGARFDGSAAGESFGWSVAVGDVNGDGLGDLIIGAPARPPAAGSVYIRFGSTGFTQGITDMSDSNEVNVLYTGSNTGDQLGFKVTTGAVSGGAFDDLVMSAPGFDQSVTDQGAIFIAFSGNVVGGDASATTNCRLLGSAAGMGFGRVCEVAEVNGDSVGDIAFSEPLRTGRGFAYLQFGPLPNGGVGDLSMSNPDVRYEGETNGDLFGTSMKLVEHDGDLFRDVIIGAPGTTFNGRAQAGSVYHFSGGPGMQTGTIDLNAGPFQNSRYDGATAGDRLGTTLGGADLTGDGQVDLVMSAPLFDFQPPTESIRSNCGTAYVRMDTASFSTTDLANATEWHARFDGAAQGSRFDPFFSFGDFNDDGIQDIVWASSRNNYNNRPDSGSMYVKFGSSSLATSQESAVDDLASFDLRFDGAFTGDRLGLRLGKMGDINADGIDDLVLCAPAASNTGASSGSVYVLFGRPNWAQQVFNLANITDFDVRLDGAAPGDFLGFTASVGDLNGDGIGDLLVNASAAKFNGRLNSGSLYIIYGKATWSPKVQDMSLFSPAFWDARIDGPLAGHRTGLGPDVADFDGDGLNDLVFTSLFAGFNSKANSGSTYLTYGKPGILLLGTIDLAVAGSYDVRLDGETTGDQFGNLIYTSDLDGDGKSDLAIAAPLFDPLNPTLTNGGAAYVFYGGSRISAGNYDLQVNPIFNAKILGATANGSFIAPTSGRFVRQDHVDIICSAVSSSTAYGFQGWNNRFSGNLDLRGNTHNLEIRAAHSSNQLSLAYAYRGTTDVTGGGRDCLIAIESQGDGAHWDSGAIVIITR